MLENIDIDQQVEGLIKLQAVDSQIYRLNAEKEARPQEIKQIRDALSAKDTGIKQADAELKNLQVKRKEKEIELESKESQIKKLQTQLYQLKTNKEYSAMLGEIESQKADKSIIEEAILKLMDQIEQAESRLSQEKAKFQQEAKSADIQVKSIEESLKQVELSLVDFIKKRDELTQSIDAKILKNYEKILSGKDGLALVEVVNDACGGCYMSLPPQVINEIKMRQSIVYCESCRRMLYIKNETSV